MVLKEVQKMNTENKLLKIKDVMTVYGVSRGTIYNWIARGMPVIRNGSIVRFKADEVEKWFTKEV
jgi:excisionase family DNA binding protein